MTLNPMDFDGVVRAVARRYVRRCWWAELDELVAVGRLAAVECARTFDPTVGVPADAYVRRAAVLAMRRHLWHSSSPVTGGSHRPERALRGLHRAVIADEHLDDDSHAVLGVRLVSTLPLQDAQLDAARWRAQVRSRLEAVARRTGLMAALPVVLEDVTPAEAAAPLGWRPQRVTHRAEALRAHVMLDEPLAVLSKHRHE